MTDAKAIPKPIPPVQRGLLAILAAALLGALIVAGWLRPATSGMGSHQQLGLPPCTLVALFGVRCPTCGMTTSWAHLMRGNLRAALGANATGTLLAVLAILSLPWLIAAAWHGRWFLWRPESVRIAWVAVALAGLALGEWILRIGPWS